MLVEAVVVLGGLVFMLLLAIGYLHHERAYWREIAKIKTKESKNQHDEISRQDRILITQRQEILLLRDLVSRSSARAAPSPASRPTRLRDEHFERQQPQPQPQNKTAAPRPTDDTMLSVILPIATAAVLSDPAPARSDPSPSPSFSTGGGAAGSSFTSGGEF